MKAIKNPKWIILSILLVFIFFGVLSSGESPYPEIKDFAYNIEYRKIKTTFVDFVWEADIKGKQDKQKVLLDIVFYNSKEEEIHKISELLVVNPKKVQKFEGRKMILLKVASGLKRGGRVGVILGVLEKKY